MNFDIEKLLNSDYLKIAYYLFWAFVFALFLIGSINYTGKWYVYLVFSVTANLLLYCGFRKNSIFFDTFIGVFFWLGFWLKFTERIIFSEGVFSNAHYFDRSADAFDRGLCVATCGLLGLVLASYFREKFWYSYAKEISEPSNYGLLEFYKRYRKGVLATFILLIIAVGFTNFYLGIYQRGTLPKIKLPFGLNGIYTWLLMFGLASISAVIIRLEILLKRQYTSLLTCIGLFESFVSNTSMLSRGMMLNGVALLYGIVFELQKHAIVIKVRSIFVTIVIFCILFVSSVLVVNYLRILTFQVKADVETQVTSFDTNESMASSLVLGRWLGIEEVLAVSSKSSLGWDVWNDAWKEKPTTQNEKTHYFDRVFTHVKQVEIDRSKYHFISTLPGVIAFFFYPGSYIFLLVGIFSIGLLAAGLEYFAYHLSGMNVILTAFFSQVVAFRFMNFGYAPSQSYLLLGTLIANVVIIYLVDRLLAAYYKSKIHKQRQNEGFDL